MIRIGPGGTGGRDYLEALALAKSLGMSAFEAEFTYGVTMTDAVADLVSKKAKELDISLSCHAPYFVNLASVDKKKIEASKKRIIDSAKKLHRMGGGAVVFHPGFYGTMQKDDCYDMIVEGIKDIKKETDKYKGVVLAPETTGKPSQFGDIDELLRVAKELSIGITIDFAHLKARNAGVIDYDKEFLKFKNLPHIHSHFSGIEWTPKGEKKHLMMTKEDFLPIGKNLLKHNMDATLICESPDMYKDGENMVKWLEAMR